MLVFAACRLEIVPSIADTRDVAAGGARVLGAYDRAEVNAFEIPNSEGLDNVGSPSACKSLAAAAIPCWVPLTRSCPRATVAECGGKNPNGVFTLAGPVE